MFNRYCFFFVLLALTACRPYNSQEFTRYHDDGRIKPKVALLPVSFSSSQFPYPWDITQELTENVRQELMQQNTLFVPDNVNFSPVLSLRQRDLVTETSPMILELKNQYDFAVILDLVSHEQEAYKGQNIKPVYNVYGEAANVLKMTMRVGVFDLRGSQPKSILQEIVHSNHLITKEGAATNYDKVVWQTDAYKTSPFGLAHSRLSKEVATRMSDYIELSRR